MKKTVVFGLALVALTFLYSFTLPSGDELRIDLAPDFLGFVLIYLGLEKLSCRSRIFRELSSTAVFFGVVSFLTFLAQLAPFYASFFAGDLKFIAILAYWIGEFYNNFEFLFIAVYMIYIAVFCLAFAFETSVRIKNAPQNKSFSQKNEYSETIYSQWAYRLYYAFSIIFSILFFAISVLSIIYHFTDLSVAVFGIKTGLWITFLPASILFIAYENTAVNLVRNELKI